MKRLICISLIAVFAATAALADIAPENTPKPPKEPKTKPAISTTLVVRLDSKATEARLIIPKSQIKQLRAQLDNIDDDDSTAAVTSSRGIGRVQTLVSGMFLSLAFILGGMWFVRSGKAATRSGKALVIATCFAGIASAASLAYANAGPPPEARVISGRMFSQAVQDYSYGSGKIMLETRADDTSSAVELIVPNPKDKPKNEE